MRPQFYRRSHLRDLVADRLLLVMFVLMMVENRRIDGRGRIVGRCHGRSHVMGLFGYGQIHGVLMGRKLFHVRVNVLRVEDGLVLVRREQHVVQEVDVGASTQGTVQRMIWVVHLCFLIQTINTNMFSGSLFGAWVCPLRSLRVCWKIFRTNKTSLFHNLKTRNKANVTLLFCLIR